jgi:hypothetical protein
VAALDVARTVVGSRSHWDRGLIVTRLRLEAQPGARPASETVTVLGGQVGTIRQVVGNALPPPVGCQLRIGPPRTDGTQLWVARGANQHPVGLEMASPTPPR